MPTSKGAGNVAKLRSIVNVRDPYWGATGDGVTDDRAAIQAAIDALWAAGGGQVYLPEGHYRGTGAANMLELRPYVSICGDGYSTLLDFDWNVFHSWGVSSSATLGFGAYTFRTLAAVSAGDRTVTLTDPSQSSDFTVGDCAVLRSVTEDATRFPSFVELVKITAIDSGTGEITLEDPIEDAIADPQLGASPFNATTPFVQGIVVENLRAKGDYTNGSQPFFLDGLYKSVIRNCWFEGNHLASWNGITKCTIQNINAIVHPVSGGDFPGIEVKMGSYRSSYLDIKCQVANIDGLTTYFKLNSIGERSRDITIDHLEILAPELNVTYGLLETTAVRGRYSHIDISAKNMSYCVFLQSGNHETTHGIEKRTQVEHVRGRVSGSYAVALGLSMGTPTTYGKGCEISDLRMFGTSGTVNGVAANSIIWGGSVDCHVRGLIADGLYDGTTGSPSNCHMYNCITGGPISAATRANITEHDCRSTGSTAEPAPAQIFNQATSSIVANTVLATLTVPANYPWIAGDKVKFRIAGAFSGVNDVKNVAIADTTGAIYTLTVAAGVTGAFVIEATAVVIGVGANVNYRLTGFSFVGTTIAVLNALTATAKTGTVPFYIEGWVANAGDSITIFQGEMQFSRKYDSLSDGATVART